MHNVVSHVAGALDRLYAMTKEGHLSDQGRSLKIALFGISSDSKHFDLAIDAFATFCPKATLTFFTDDPLHLAAHSECPELIRANVRHYSSFLKRSPETWDLLVMLHPRPFGNRENMGQLRPLMRVFRIGSLLHPSAKCLMLHRDLELWKASLRASIARKLILILKKPILALLLKMEERTLQAKVFPHLPHAQSWNAPHLCAHNNSVNLFTDPRPLDFCPECGMGITPKHALPRLDDASICYGAGYALYGRYTGFLEFSRSIRENNQRVNGYLKQLGFSDSQSNPADQGAARVLDYGCGNGRMFPLWHDRGHDYLGVDYSSANVDFARELASKIAPNARTKAEFLCGTLDTIAMENQGPFSVVFLSHVLEHVKDPTELLSELRRLSSRNAFLYVEVPNAFTYAWNMAQRGYANEQHLWDFTPLMLERIACAAGWSDVRIHLDPDQKRYSFIALLAKNHLAQ